jgi:hypothetical protein
MAKKIIDEFSILAAHLKAEDLGYIAFSNDDVAQNGGTFLGFMQFKINEPFKNIATSEENLAGIANSKIPIEQFIAVGHQGTVICSGKGDNHVEIIGDDSFGPKTKGPLRCVRTIEDTTFAVGMGRQLFRREGVNDWKRFDKGITTPDVVTGFESVNGKSKDDLYTAGWNGEIWHCQNDEWSQLHSPTNRIITDICIADDDIYMCGQSGLILKKNKLDFELIEIPDFKFDIWSMAWFQGSLYLSTFYGIFKYADGGLDFIDLIETIGAKTTYKLSSFGNILWSYGAKDIVEYDGKTWKRVI